MKNCFISLILIFVFTNMQATSRNINPDKNGDPWIVTDFPTNTEQENVNIISLKTLLKENNFRLKRNLPYKVDNSKLPYFRSVFRQTHGSCSQAAGVAYTFTYEINRIRKTKANSYTTSYPTHYTYNFLNNGEDTGSHFISGWKIIKEHGCPNVQTYGGLSAPLHHWMSGYEKYRAAMSNRIKDIYSIKIQTANDIIVMKNWFINHLSDAEDGGIFCFAAGISYATFSVLPPESEAATSMVVKKWSSLIDHAMTVVGYNDSLKFDFNNDGKFTNNIDLNNDGVIDVRDWEMGGVKIVNSWGTNWGNSGTFYMMYKHLADNSAHGGIYDNELSCITVLESYTPIITTKYSIIHDSRARIRLSLGVSETDKNKPTFKKEVSFLNNYDGKISLATEFAFDLTPLLSQKDVNKNLKYYLIAEEEDNANKYSGSILSCVSYKNDVESKIIIKENSPKKIDGKTTIKFTEKVNIKPPLIITNSLPSVKKGEQFTYQLESDTPNQNLCWNLEYYDINNESKKYHELSDEQIVYADNWWDGFHELDLAFDFPFYGEVYDKIYISTNGAINFENRTNSINGSSDLQKDASISCFLSSLYLNPINGDAIKVKTENSTVTIQWEAVNSINNSPIRGTIKLHNDGTIKIFYPSDNPNSLTAGISSGENGFQTFNIQPKKMQSFHLDYNNIPTTIKLASDGTISGYCPLDNYYHELPIVVSDINGLSSRKNVAFSVLPDYSENIDELKISIAPNPFNNSTSILFDVKNGNKQSSIKIYNIKGQLVRTLISETLPEGRQLVKWFGDDNSNKKVSSGFYFCKIKNGKFNIIKKLTYIQ